MNCNPSTSGKKAIPANPQPEVLGICETLGGSSPRNAMPQFQKTKMIPASPQPEVLADLQGMPTGSVLL